MSYYEDDFAPLATPGDAHREWHLNAGVPMGTPGCPQDACHPQDEYDYYESEFFNPVDQGVYDDDPNPYHGDYSDDFPF